MTRLNGWQRLWTVVVVIWLLLVLAFGYLLWPTAMSVPKSDVYVSIPPASGRGLIDYYDILAPKQGGQSEPLVGADVTDWFAKYATENQGPTVHIDGHILQFRKGVSENTMSQLSGDYYGALHRILTVKRSKFVGAVFVSWILPVIVLYLLGWAIAWVRSGFAPVRA